ncbi:MAG: hypothetical protein IJ837_01330 [Clostridia bacterium]|nr:hypothetical protein [Clostridia bacterium]
MEEGKIKKISKKIRERIYNFKKKFSFETMKRIFGLRKKLKETNNTSDLAKEEQEKLKNLTKDKEKLIKEPQYFIYTRSYDHDFYNKYAKLEPETLVDNINDIAIKYEKLNKDTNDQSFSKIAIKSNDNKNDAYAIVLRVFDGRVDNAGRQSPTWFGVVVDASDENNFDEKAFCEQVNKDVEEMKKNNKTTFDLASKYPIVWNEKEQLNENQKKLGVGERDIYQIAKDVFWEVPKERGKKDFYKPHQQENTRNLG